MKRFKANLKGVFILLVVCVIWLFFIFYTWFGYFQLGLLVLCALFQLVHNPLNLIFRHWSWHKMFMLKFDKVRHKLNSWCLTLWLANDQYLNALLFGSEDHSISGRVGYYAIQGNKTAIIIEKIIDVMFFITIGQKGHCRSNIEWDEIRNRVTDN